MKFIKQSSDLSMICMSMVAAAALAASAWAGPGVHSDCKQKCNHPADCPMMSGDRTANFPVADTALASAFTTQDGANRQGEDQEITQVISSKIQDQDGNIHSVIIKRTIDDGKESVDLTIDGKNYHANSMEQANKILEDNGITGFAQMDMPDVPDMPMFGQPGHPNGNHQPNDRKQRAIQRPRAMLGVSLAPVNPAVRSYLGIEDGVGVMVADVVPDTPAEEAGLKSNDLITGIAINNNIHTVNEQSLRKIIAQQKPGNEVDLQILRAGQAITVPVKLAKWDGDKLGVRFEQEPRIIRGLHPDQFNNMPNNMMKDMPNGMMKDMPNGKMKCNPDMMKGMHNNMPNGKMKCNPDMMKGMHNNMPDGKMKCNPDMMKGMGNNMPNGKMKCNPDMMKGMGNNMPNGKMKCNPDMMKGMGNNMPDGKMKCNPDMMKGMGNNMPNGMMKNMPDNMMKEMREFRLQLDPENGTWKWFDENGDQDNDNDTQFQGEPDFNRMMQMMEQRMRRFEMQMQKMLKQQNQMRKQMNKQQHSNNGIDT